jgi:hypothetical protein
VLAAARKSLRHSIPTRMTRRRHAPRHTPALRLSCAGSGNRTHTRFLSPPRILSPVRLPVPPSRHYCTCALEARAGIEPAHNGFADRCVTTSPSGQFSDDTILRTVEEVVPVYLFRLSATAAKSSLSPLSGKNSTRGKGPSLACALR